MLCSYTHRARSRVFHCVRAAVVALVIMHPSLPRSRSTESHEHGGTSSDTIIRSSSRSTESHEQSTASSETVADPLPRNPSKAELRYSKLDWDHEFLDFAEPDYDGLRHLSCRPVTHDDLYLEKSIGYDEKGPDPDLVTWDGPDDPRNPHNWSFVVKSGITGIWIFANLCTAMSSSIYSSGVGQLQQEFGMSPPVATLGVSLFLCGYAIGPIFFSPLSEKYGRKWPTLIGVFGSALFCICVALGQNIPTVLLGRFFEGTFGAAPIAIVGGGIVDIWGPEERGVALSIGIGSVMASPVLAPVIGNFIVQSYLGWRWTAWLSGIMGLACSILILIGLPETFAPVLLQRKATKARAAGNPAAHSQFDATGRGLGNVVRVYLVRPFVMLATEPILLLVTVYQAFVYGILYLIFEALPIAFREERGWALGVSALPFLAVLTGILLGTAVVIWHTRTAFVRRLRANGGRVVPEARLPLMIGGGVLLPVGCFIFAWTSDPRLTYAGMIVGSVPMGMGLYMIFVQCTNYIVDVYVTVANSAIGGNTFVRSFFGAGFPLFAPYMYHGLGVNWATSLLGFVSIAMIPIPVVFYVYGATIRSWSKNSPNKAGSTERREKSEATRRERKGSES